MQTALHDLMPTRTTNPRAFNTCQRVLHKCHEILFGDPPEPSRSPYRSLSPSPYPSSAVLGQTLNSELYAPATEPLVPPARVNPHAFSAIVGMSAMIAGPGMPGLTGLVGEWAVLQGRKPIDHEQESRSRVEVDRTGGADAPRDGKWDRMAGARQVESDGSDDEEGRRPLPRRALSTGEALHTEPARPPLLPSHTSPLIRANESAPAFHPEADMRGRDPFGQGSGTPPAPPPRLLPIHQPFHSVPELPSAGGLNRRGTPGRPPSADNLLATYSLEAQRQLLKSHYCRSEIRFLLLLEDISNRLLVIPKPARISALRAELTSLNHMLPAEVCMPLWCNADHHRHGERKESGFFRDSKGRNMSHSRVVRISPGDSVVLNSAERAPYVLHVEILQDDLDFDPTRRENRELLKKIVLQEDLKRRKKEQGLIGTLTPPSFEGFGSAMPDVPVVDVQEDYPEDEDVSVAMEARKSIHPEEVEEMDLVEQLYGNKLSVRDQVPDLTASIPLPSAPKNKQLDLEVWNASHDDSRRSSLTGGLSPYRPGTPNGESLAVETPDVRPVTPVIATEPMERTGTPKRVITLEDYAERMRTAAVMLAQLNASQQAAVPETQSTAAGALRWIPGTGWIMGSKDKDAADTAANGTGGKLRLAAAQAAAIRERIMEEMMALEEERVQRMTSRQEGVEMGNIEGRTAEDEGIVRREINKADPSAAVFKESWSAKKSRIRASSPWGHLANWDVISVIVKTGADLRQEQLATQLIERFTRIWKEEKSDCWARFFRILITGESSGLVETITDAVSVHSIKKSEYTRRVAEGDPIGHVSLMDHFVNTYGKPDSGIFARARRNFIKSLAGYSVITYLLQIKDRHNGNILVDRDGRLIHIDFGFMLSNSPGGNMGFEAAPFKMPLEYVEIMGGLDSPGYAYFRKLFKEGFEAARKHSDSLIAIVELMQKDSKLDCFALFGENTVTHFRERFALGLTTQAVDAYLERLMVSSTGSNYTRLYDTFQYYRYVCSIGSADAQSRSFVGASCMKYCME